MYVEVDLEWVNKIYYIKKSLRICYSKYYILFENNLF